MDAVVMMKIKFSWLLHMMLKILCVYLGYRKIVKIQENREIKNRNNDVMSTHIMISSE